jgi:hypothetical protein
MSSRAGAAAPNHYVHPNNTNAVPDINLMGDEDETHAVSYRWLDKGVAYHDGRLYHEAVQLTTQGRTFQVRKGDAVLLFSGDRSDLWSQWPCRVENMWEQQPMNDRIDPAAQNFVDPARIQPVLFTARWFWHKGDLEQLPYNWDSGSLTKEEFVARMAADEVVLSNHLVITAIVSIDSPCYMTYRTTSKKRIIRPPSGERIHQHQHQHQHLPKRFSFQCQYKLEIMPGNSAVKFIHMTSTDSRFLARFLTEDQRQAIKDQRQAIQD